MLNNSKIVTHVLSKESLQLCNTPRILILHDKKAQHSIVYVDQHTSTPGRDFHQWNLFEAHLTSANETISNEFIPVVPAGDHYRLEELFLTVTKSDGISYLWGTSGMSGDVEIVVIDEVATVEFREGVRIMPVLIADSTGKVYSQALADLAELIPDLEDAIYGRGAAVHQLVLSKADPVWDSWVGKWDSPDWKVKPVVRPCRSSVAFQALNYAATVTGMRPRFYVSTEGLSAEKTSALLETVASGVGIDIYGTTNTVEFNVHTSAVEIVIEQAVKIDQVVETYGIIIELDHMPKPADENQPIVFAVVFDNDTPLIVGKLAPKKPVQENVDV